MPPSPQTTTLNPPYVTILGSTNTVDYFGPLTTLWTPPARCSRTITQVAPNEDNFIIYGVYGGQETYCWPPVGGGTLTAPATINPNPESRWGYYSPAICPSGWSTSATWPDFQISGSNSLSLSSGISTAVCCPP